MPLTTAPIDPSDLPTVFADLRPIPQDDGPHPVCAIAYSDDFVRAHDYLRAVLRADELSNRTLRLTALCLELNPANYTVWHYRRKILLSLSAGGGDNDGAFDASLVESDLTFAAKLGGGNPKNYQIWYHRRALLEPTFEKDGARDNEDIMRTTRDEMGYVGNVLKEDAKNYHAWSHRQWICRTLNSSTLWSEEKEYTQSLISDDPRNNSAWNQMWFATHRGLHVSLNADNARSECEYALGVAALDPHNESPWRYLVGVVKERLKESEKSDAVDLIGFCLKEITGIRDRTGEKTVGVSVACPNLMAAHADLLEMDGGGNSLKEAADIVHSLAIEQDIIRRKYWSLREQQLLSSLEKVQ